MEKTILLVLLSVLLSACTAPAPVNVEVTRIVVQTAVVTQIVERVVTATPLPPTATPLPSATSLPFTHWTADQVIEAFKAAGLEVDLPHPMTKEDYGIAPMAPAGVIFKVPSICDCNVRVMAFDNAENHRISKEYYEEMGKKSAMLFSWVFVKDNIVVQMNGSIPQDVATKYGAALEALK